MNEPRSNILDRVDRKLSLREITQSVPALIVVELPLILNEGMGLEHSRIEEHTHEDGRMTVRLIVEISHGYTESAS
jgi:hypothetical protein